MTQWLYDSLGSPVAFIANEHYVFHISGECIGKVIGTRVWNKQYVGEIMGDRLFCNPLEVHSRKLIMMCISRPGVPTPPRAKMKVPPPLGYRDVYLDEI